MPETVRRAERQPGLETDPGRCPAYRLAGGVANVPVLIHAACGGVQHRHVGTWGRQGAKPC